MAKILVPLPDHDFDITEVAVPWRLLRDAGHEPVFATEAGATPACDPLLITGVIFGKLGAHPEPLAFYRELEQAPEFVKPIAWSACRAEDFDALLLAGGHAPGMRQYLGSEVVQQLVAAFFATDKPIAAICHGVLVAARSHRPDGKSVLHGVKTTCLPKYMERSAYLATFWRRGKYYRTYPAYVEEEVRAAVASPDDFIRGPRTLSKRGTRDNDAPAFVVEDGRYVSARWPGDAYLFTKKLLERLPAARALAAAKLMILLMLCVAPVAARADAGEACAAILDRGFHAATPVLPKLRIARTHDFERDYKKDSFAAHSFLESCAQLAPRVRECLARQPNPFDAISRCDADSSQLRFPDLHTWSPVGKPPPLSSAEAEELARYAVGSWTDDTHYERWDVRRDGTMRRRVGSIDRVYRMEFKWRGLVGLYDEASNYDVSFFVKDGPDRIYAGGNNAYRVHPIESEQAFDIATVDYFFLYDHGRCEAISSEGVARRARCTFNEEHGARAFRIELFGPDNKASVYATYNVISGFLIDPLRVALRRVMP